MFYKAGFIESWGRGISKIKSGFKEAGLVVPVFENKFGGIGVTMYRSGYVVENVVEKLTERKKKIVEVVIKFNKISAKDLSEMLNVTSRTIQRELEELKSLGILKREGADKGGNWIVIK